MKGAIAKAEELAKEIPNSPRPVQQPGEPCPQRDHRTWKSEDTDGTVFVAGVGTGGTVTGVGVLKGKKPGGRSSPWSR